MDMQIQNRKKIAKLENNKGGKPSYPLIENDNRLGIVAGDSGRRRLVN